MDVRAANIGQRARPKFDFSILYSASALKCLRFCLSRNVTMEAYHFAVGVLFVGRTSLTVRLLFCWN
jgi:hypothetical protein